MENKLKRLQTEMLQMLKMFDGICKKYDIKYSLHGGTLLGAVRHKGFIPWDDDLDVIMLRSEYDRFIEIWNKERPDGFFLQNKNFEEAYTRSFTKIRKENTTFLQMGEDPEKIHTGVFIDIFPIDRGPKNKLIRLFYYWDCLRYQLYCREFVPAKGNSFIKCIAKCLLSTSSKEQRIIKREKLLKKITHYNENDKLPLACIETVGTMQRLFDADTFSNYTYLEFEGENFMCIEEWEKLLILWFGDYMKLPPVEQQTWKHQPLALDFEHDYKDYMNLKEYTLGDNEK